ncbi:MAG: BON domain-containing protein [Halanaerobiales bacterium]
MSLFGSSYDDERLKKEALNAIDENPTIRGLPNINIISKDGKVSIFGSAKNDKQIKKIRQAIEEKYENNNLEYETIENDLISK